jgi:hypothetical protein
MVPGLGGHLWQHPGGRSWCFSVDLGAEWTQTALMKADWNGHEKWMMDFCELFFIWWICWSTLWSKCLRLGR